MKTVKFKFPFLQRLKILFLGGFTFDYEPEVVRNEVEKIVEKEVEKQVMMPYEVPIDRYVPVDARYPLLGWDENMKVDLIAFLNSPAGVQLIQQVKVHKAVRLEELLNPSLPTEELVKNASFLRGIDAAIDFIKSLTVEKKVEEPVEDKPIAGRVISGMRVNERFGVGLFAREPKNSKK